MRTLNLKQAAAFLNMHPVTVQERARAGTLPGAKPGKCWVFLEEDLAAYLRALSPSTRQALQGDVKEPMACHSTNARAHLNGGFDLPTTDDAYERALGLRTGQRRSSTTID
ncbi:MAG: helix-turn-helix domain-containing protein [Burkholderiales bacterium]